jgi:hypothetical protein
MHATYVIKALLADGSLCEAAAPHLEACLLLALRGFCSPLWLIRNASLQLYSVALQRVLGANLAQSDYAARISLSTFARR